MRNPHAVAFVESLDDAGSLFTAPPFSPASAYPTGVNVEFVVDRGPGNPYTTGGAADCDEERVDPTRPGWLSRLLDWQQSAPDPDTFWTVLRAELAQDREVTVFAVDGAAAPRTGRSGRVSWPRR